MMNGQIDRMDGQIFRIDDRCDGWMDGWMDTMVAQTDTHDRYSRLMIDMVGGWMYGWTDRQRDRMDGQTDIQG